MDRWLLACFAIPNLIVLGLWFWRGGRLRWLALAAALLPGICWAGFMRVITTTLEGPYERRQPTGEAQAIVLFPGAVMPPEPERPVPMTGGNSYERAFYAAWLYNHGRQLPILVCGGPDRDGGGLPFSQTIRLMLIHESVPADMVWTEDRSQSTYENALYAAGILRAKNIRRIILVTEAYHMMRAERCMRKLGFEVIPAPCSFRSRFHLRAEHLLPSREDFNYSIDSLHELIGLGWYAVRGRI